MLRSLHTRITFVAFVLFLGLGLLFLYINGVSSRLYQQETQQQLSRNLAQHIVSEQGLVHNGALQKDRLKQLFEMIMHVNPAIEMYTLDLKGNITAYAAPDEKIIRHKVDLKPIKAFLKDNSHLPILGDDPRDLSSRKIFSVAEVKENGVTACYLYIILGGETYQSIAQGLQRSYTLKMSFGMILGATLFALLAAVLIFRALTRRMRRLSHSMEEFRESGFNERVELPAFVTSRDDEIGQLASTYQEMADRIVDQMAKLRQGDQKRRELIANVSHDLRTPLTTLQGYLETLLNKKTRLSDEELHAYLETAVQNAQRLSKLVSELFELARLDANETHLRIEAFSLQELVHDVIQKFWLRASERNISIETSLSSSLPFVSADIGLMERVLENLIENAIRYTPDGGKIDIKLERMRDGVQVEIHDNGMGIAKKDLNLIFERFYRPEKSRASHSGGAGLGLAIARRILELHGGTIQAHSEMNKGTCFTFYLPVQPGSVS